MMARRTLIVGWALAHLLGGCALFDSPSDYAPSADGGVDATAPDGGGSDAADESACGSCPGRAHAQSTCVGGACALACASPFLDCNGDAADGCEIDPTTGDPANCGACTKRCDSGVCDQGACAAGCAAGRAQCNGGCFDLTTSPENCGACGVVCPSPANTIAACTSGKCAVACVLGYLDCNGNPGDGCETSSTDVANCGSCKNACTPGPNTTAACVGAACTYACTTGHMDCNHDLGVATGNGCECPAPLVCHGTQCTGN